MSVGKIHSIETCGAVDGPGIRYVVFFQGCPLRCGYCHNPDTWNSNSKDAKEMSVAELISDIEEYKMFMNFSGGGITATGGEPLMQAEFVSKLFKACKEIGIHTALDTSGYANQNELDLVLPYTDMVLLDLKSINDKTFKNISGRELDKTLETAYILNERKIRTWIRFVLVPGLSDNMEEIKNLANFILPMKNVELIEILPFHKLGEYKWEELGLDYKFHSTKSPTHEDISSVKKIFSDLGIKVR